VVAFLENFFARYVEYDFTAALEEQLDRISNNEISWQQVLHDFWRGFIGAVNDIKDLRVAEVLDALDDMLGPHIYAPRADGGDPRQCPTCGTGKLNLKAGKFGAFVGCTNYPECRYTRPLAADSEASADRVLGQDPETGRDVIVKAGRFGPYIQLGEQKDYAEGEKPKRAGIPKNISPSDIELDLALKLLSLPREVGKHPETGEPITAGLGRFGPFVKHEKTYASLEAGDEVFDIGLNRAVTLIAEKVAKGPSGRRFGADPGKPLGDHPSLGAVVVKNGRYGAYVSAGGINATIQGDKTVDTITLPEAIALIDERAAKGGGSKRSARKAAKPAKAAKPEKTAKSKVEKPKVDKLEADKSGADAATAKPAKKVAAKKTAAKPKSDATSKARAPVTAKTPVSRTSVSRTSVSKTPASKAAKPAAKKSAGKASG
jgi:DNA topoisomerase-1